MRISWFSHISEISIFFSAPMPDVVLIDGTLVPCLSDFWWTSRKNFGAFFCRVGANLGTSSVTTRKVWNLMKLEKILEFGNLFFGLFLGKLFGKVSNRAILSIFELQRKNQKTRIFQFWKRSFSSKVTAEKHLRPEYGNLYLYPFETDIFMRLSHATLDAISNSHFHPMGKLAS